MDKRILAASVVTLAAVAAAAPAAWAGEDGGTTPAPVTDPPAVTVTQPAPPPVTVTQPAPPAVTVTQPAPPTQTVTVRVPAPRPARPRKTTAEAESKSPPVTRHVVAVTRYRTVAAQDTDSAPVPSGGIQAGGGGTAAAPSDRTGVLLGLGAGASVLLLTGRLGRRRMREQP